MLIEQTVTLRIRRPVDGTPPAGWNWPELIDEADVVVVDASTITLIPEEA